MLQQTRIETALPYYRRFLKRFPSLEALASAPVEDVLTVWSGLGYYRRARSLHEGARKVREEHGGGFPREFAAALEIPGVGPYTAGAVLSIAYNLPVPVVDGNVERVLGRFYKLKGNPRSSPNARALRDLAGTLIPAGRASDFNQALMELGALVCTPETPNCSRCPLRTACAARRSGHQSRFPEYARARPTVAVTLETIVLLRGGACLLERRQGTSVLEGLWLPPVVEGSAEHDPAEPSRTPGRELVQALASSTGVDVSAASYVGEARHSITYRRIRVRVFLLKLEGKEVGRPGHPARFSDTSSPMRWVPLEDLGRKVPVSSLVFKIVRLLGEPRGEPRRFVTALP
jgi:A/G-specific adenine glycosylase